MFIILQGFMLLIAGYGQPMVFFLAGYMIPAQYYRKGPKPFLRDRFIRLAGGNFVFTFTVSPFLQWFTHCVALKPVHAANPDTLHQLRTGYMPCPVHMWWSLAVLLMSIVWYLLAPEKAPEWHEPEGDTKERRLERAWTFPCAHFWVSFGFLAGMLGEVLTWSQIDITLGMHWENPTMSPVFNWLFAGLGMAVYYKGSMNKKNHS